MKTTKFSQTEASVLLDVVRGLAAIVVLGEHWRNFLFVDYPQVHAHRELLLLPYLLTSAGHQAVVVFFVLSGYLISGSIFRSLKQGSFKWGLYATHRLVRLWMVVLPGLLLCAGFDWLGIGLHRAPLLYGGAAINHMTPNVRLLLTPRIFLGNVFFLQTLRVPIFGSDGALWSLANEFWYYALFPLGLMLLMLPARQKSVLVWLANAAVLVAIVWLLPASILWEFPIWLLGSLLAIAPVPVAGRGVRWAAAALYVPFFFACARIGFLGQWFRSLPSLWVDYALGLATFAFLWLMLSAHSAADERSRVVSASRLLARLSFTLYVLHMPLLVLLTSLTAGDSRWVPDAKHIACGLGLLALVGLITYGVASLTEFRTDEVRAWLERKLGLTKPVPKRPGAGPLDGAKPYNT